MSNKQKRNSIIYNAIFTALIIIGSILFLSHYAYISTPYVNSIEKINMAIEHMQTDPFDMKRPNLLSVVLVFVFCLSGFAHSKLKIDEKARMRQGVEKGSGSWNQNMKKYNKIYTSPKKKKHNKGDKNMILTNDVYLSMDGRQTQRNNNILVVGGSGAGKSRFFVKPNLLQANSSYVVTDPSGELLKTTGKFLESKGYDIRVFNLVNMANSNTYNPFHYIRNDEGVLSMVNALMKNTDGGKKGGGDPFWEKSEKALLEAICYYLYYVMPLKEQHFGNVMEMISFAKLDGEDDSKPTILDVMMEDLKLKDPEHIAVKQYDIFKQAPGKTAMSILVTAAVRLGPFNVKSVKALTSSNNIDLSTVGDKKVALFCITPVIDTTFNFLVAMMYNQLFETLYYHAENDFKDNRLPVPVRFLLDEFANIGTIPDFEQKLATMRKYEISCSIILQNISQLKTLYEKSWEGIMGNCDTFLFLGGQEQTTLKTITEKLGKETIIVKGNSRNIGGKNGGGSESVNISDRDLMTPDEVGRMPNTHCIAQIRGILPFYSKKYDYLKHPNYKLTGDYDEKNILNINDYFKKEESVEDSPYEKIIKEKLKKKQEIKTTSNKGREFLKEANADDFIIEENINSINRFEEIMEFDEVYSPDFEYGEPENFDDIFDDEEDYI